MKPAEAQLLLHRLRGESVPINLLSADGDRAHEWLMGHELEHGRPPSEQMFCDLFNIKPPPDLDPLDELIKVLRQAKAEAALQQIAEIIGGSDDPMTAINEIIQSTNNLQLELSVADQVAKLSDFAPRLDQYIADQEAGVEPRVASLGFPICDDVTNGLEKGDILVLYGATSDGKCVKWNTPIVDSNTGAVTTVQDLYRRGQAGQSFRAMAVGQDLKLSQYPISDFIDNGIRPVYKVTTRWGRTIETTLTHPYLTLDGWKPLSEIQIGERIASPRSLPIFGREALPDAEIIRLAYLIGDGGLTSATPHFSKSVPEMLQELAECAASYGAQVKRAGTDGRDCFRISTTRGQPNPVADMLKAHGLMGKKSVDKVIPEAVYRLPKPQLALFLNRLYSTDGTACQTSAKVEVSYCSASEQLARGVQHLLLRFGINARFRERQMKYQGGVRTAYDVAIQSAEDILIFNQEIGIFGRREQLASLAAICRSKVHPRGYTSSLPSRIWDIIDEERGEIRWFQISRQAGFIRRSHSWGHTRRSAIQRYVLAQIAVGTGSQKLKDLSESDLFWDEVASIEYVGEEQVYDFTVPGPHNFVAADICLHNSSLARKIATNNVRDGKRVIYFALEEDLDVTFQLMETSYAGMNSSPYTRGHYTPEQVAELRQSLTGMTGECYVVSYLKGIADVMTHLLALKPDFYVLDQLTVYSSSLKWDVIADSIRALKMMSARTRIPGIILTQANKVGEVGFSTAISHNADKVGRISPDPKDGMQHKEIEWTKNRRGRRLQTIQFNWDLENGIIEELIDISKGFVKSGAARYEQRKSQMVADQQKRITDY